MPVSLQVRSDTGFGDSANPPKLLRDAARRDPALSTKRIYASIRDNPLPEFFWWMHIDSQMWSFIRRLARYEHGATRKELQMLGRSPERVYTRARMLGYAIYVDGKWHITSAGREAIARQEVK
jgi:hypothetical protein